MSASPVGCGTTKRPKGRELLKRVVLGQGPFSQQCVVGLYAPQSEIGVWLHGMGAPLDVTSTNVIAGTQPLVIGIGAGIEQNQHIAAHQGLVLVLREQHGDKRILGKISLKWIETISLGAAQLNLFEALHSVNYCLPKPRQWARYLYHRYQKWHSGIRSTASDLRISQRELECVFTFYICPRPVALVSVSDGGQSNIFPMDLIGGFGDGHFSLALHANSCPAPLLHNSRKIALSDLPIEQTQLAQELGKNHNKTSVDWSRIGFATTTSPTFRLPVPQFSTRVREMQIDAVRDMGGHKLFLARTITDRQRSDGLQLHFIHGFYQSWRERMRITEV